MSEDELESIREQKRAELVGEGNAEDEASEVGSNEPIHVENVEEFSTVTTDYDVVLVDFYADWCGPCKMLEPTIEAIAQKTDAAVAKVDVDQHQGLASQYGVRGVPTLLVFADGEQVEQISGVQDEANLTKLLKQYT